jgi:hypothetical protein
MFIAASVVLLALYFAIYQWAFLPDPWNDIFTYFAFPLAAGLAAASALAIWLSFGKGEPPKRIWFHYALALLGWALAELAYAIIATLNEGDVPIPSITDLFWTVSYGAFAAAFLYQFRILFNPSRRKENTWLAAGFGGAIVVTLLGVLLFRLVVEPETEQTWIATLIMVFYPVADIVLALAALRLARTFGSGLWGRAWIGLIVMAMADLLYSWLDLTGLYANSVAQGNLLSLAADWLYLLSYLILAFGCYSQYLLVKFGPPPAKTTHSLADDEPLA